MDYGSCIWGYRLVASLTLKQYKIAPWDSTLVQVNTTPYVHYRGNWDGYLVGTDLRRCPRWTEFAHYVTQDVWKMKFTLYLHVELYTTTDIAFYFVI